MPTTKKIFTVQNLAAKFKQAKALILTDYSGLNVSQINELRQQIKKAGGEFEVVKNTLVCLAAENSKFQIPNSKLVGPTAALWIYKDDLEPLKILDAFIKKNELPKIKFGFWQKEEIDRERIEELAKIPGRSELQGRIIAMLHSPTFRLVYYFEGWLKNLLLVLQTIAEKSKNSQEGGEN